MTGIIKEMQRVVADVIGDENLASKTVYALIKAFGGERIYIPLCDCSQRNADIVALHTAGVDVTQLARRYKLAEKTVKNILSSSADGGC